MKLRLHPDTSISFEKDLWQILVDKASGKCLRPVYSREIETVSDKSHTEIDQELVKCISFFAYSKVFFHFNNLLKLRSFWGLINA